MKREFDLVVIVCLPFQSGAWIAPAAVAASSPAAPLLRSGDEPVAGATSWRAGRPEQPPVMGNLRELTPSHRFRAQPHRGQLLPDHTGQGLMLG
jgi:hypothetical protein